MEKDAARSLHRYLSMLVDQHGEVSPDMFFRIVQRVFLEYSTKQAFYPRFNPDLTPI